MQRSTNGPDWIDISGVMQAMQDLHGVEVTISIRLPESGRLGPLVVTATAKLRAALDTARVPSVSRSSPAGSGNPATVAAATFRLLYDLDRDCGTFWVQEEIDTEG